MIIPQETHTCRTPTVCLTTYTADVLSISLNCLGDSSWRMGLSVPKYATLRVDAGYGIKRHLEICSNPMTRQNENFFPGKKEHYIINCHSSHSTTSSTTQPCPFTRKNYISHPEGCQKVEAVQTIRETMGRHSDLQYQSPTVQVFPAKTKTSLNKPPQSCPI